MQRTTALVPVLYAFALMLLFSRLALLAGGRFCAPTPCAPTETTQGGPGRGTVVGVGAAAALVRELACREDAHCFARLSHSLTTFPAVPDTSEVQQSCALSVRAREGSGTAGGGAPSLAQSVCPCRPASPSLWVRRAHGLQPWFKWLSMWGNPGKPEHSHAARATSPANLTRLLAYAS
ncbi:hypothetical protein GGTG_09574 [Gaeumannomyces tritici R3-111a-1]|uniref:Secreted protein n=1 Tax=Gaeumannomyces tritici (strain R3-111a-1) TaxID=644352 RepID=J3P7T2_GAET3|nr:hypothetical protein GGTG_09574 [Gaeumannomyces tritici R3-111a-1]EJT72715.1 hypothetical protein GGTG_09574 [Gaeumannomyces tritici R3-111a-1]